MTVESLAVLIAGVIWPFVFQLCRKFGFHDASAQWVAVATSVIVAWIAQFLVNPAALTPENVIKNGVAVFGVATIVYRQLIKPSATPADPTPVHG